MKVLTMITRHGVSNDNVTAYTLMSQDYQTVIMSVKDLVDGITKKTIAVANLGVENGKLVSTNGALDKYTLISSQTNEIIGTAKAVILNRVEQGNKLVGYTVFTQFGTIVDMTVADAVTLANKKTLSNGKIRHTSDGDIVSAIGGNYPLREIPIDKAPKGEITVDILYFAAVPVVGAKYIGAIITCNSAAEMSKIINTVNNSNAALVSKVSKVAGQSVRKSLAVKRMGATGVYGVMDVQAFETILKSGKTTVANGVGKIAVSAINYKNEDADEAVVYLNKSWQVVEDATEGSSAAKEAQAYAKAIVSKFGTITLK